MTGIRDDAAEIGYHDELSIDLEYSWDEPKDHQDQPTSCSIRRQKRSTDHAIQGLLWSSRVDEDDRRETVQQAADILKRWNNGDYDRNEVEFDDWDKTPIETSKETRTHEPDRPVDATPITAREIDQCEGMKDLDASEYCGRVISSYISGTIDHELWHEKPNEVATILRQNDRDFLADMVDTYARQPKLTAGSNVYTEHVSVDEADTPEEYLNGLEKEYFQPI